MKGVKVGKTISKNKSQIEHHENPEIGENYCMVTNFGGGKSGAFVFLVKNKEEEEEEEVILKVYIDAFSKPLKVEKSDREHSFTYLGENYIDTVNNIRPFREIYTQCMMSSKQGYNCLIDYYTTTWDQLFKLFFRKDVEIESDKIGKDLDLSDNLFDGKSPFVPGRKKFYKDGGETDELYFSFLEPNHRVLVMEMSKSPGDSLLKSELNKMSRPILMGSLLEIISVWETSNKRIGNRWYAHWDFHPDNIFIDVKNNSRKSITIDFSGIISVINDLLGSDDLSKNLIDEKKVIDFISDDIQKIKNWMDKVVKEYLVRLSDQLGEFLKMHDIGNFNNASEELKALTLENFGKVENLFSVIGITEANLKKINKKFGGNYDQMKKKFRGVILAFVLQIVNNVNANIRSFLLMETSIRIEYPVVTLIDFDLVSSKRFDDLEDVHLSKINNSVLITERTIAWFLQYVSIGIAANWIQKLSSFLPLKNEDGSYNIKRVDHAHLLTYCLIFLSFWLYKGRYDDEEKFNAIFYEQKVIFIMNVLMTDKNIIYILYEDPIKFLKKLLVSNPHVLALRSEATDLLNIYSKNLFDYISNGLELEGLKNIGKIINYTNSPLLVTKSIYGTLKGRWERFSNKHFTETGTFPSYENVTLNISSESVSKKNRYLLIKIVEHIEGDDIHGERKVNHKVIIEYLKTKFEFVEPIMKLFTEEALIRIIDHMLLEHSILIEFSSKIEVDLKLPDMSLEVGKIIRIGIIKDVSNKINYQYNSKTEHLFASGKEVFSEAPVEFLSWEMDDINLDKFKGDEDLFISIQNIKADTSVRFKLDIESVIGGSVMEYFLIYFSKIYQEMGVSPFEGAKGKLLGGLLLDLVSLLKGFEKSSGSAFFSNFFNTGDGTASAADKILNYYQVEKRISTGLTSWLNSTLTEEEKNDSPHNVKIWGLGSQKISENTKKFSCNDPSSKNTDMKNDKVIRIEYSRFGAATSGIFLCLKALGGGDFTTNLDCMSYAYDDGVSSKKIKEKTSFELGKYNLSALENVLSFWDNRFNVGYKSRTKKDLIFYFIRFKNFKIDNDGIFITNEEETNRSYVSYKLFKTFISGYEIYRIKDMDGEKNLYDFIDKIKIKLIKIIYNIPRVQKENAELIGNHIIWDMLELFNGYDKETIDHYYDLLKYDYSSYTTKNLVNLLVNYFIDRNIEKIDFNGNVILNIVEMLNKEKFFEYKDSEINEIYSDFEEDYKRNNILQSENDQKPEKAKSRIIKKNKEGLVKDYNYWYDVEKEKDPKSTFGQISDRAHARVYEEKRRKKNKEGLVKDYDYWYDVEKEKDPKSTFDQISDRAHARVDEEKRRKK
jgi:hypothetical protein